MSSKSDLVSIVIPCYNSAKTIKRMLQTVLAQSYSDIEVIIVNDGSTDNTVKIVQEMDDPRIRIIEKENGGVSTARNAGINAAKGNYIMFFDDDDRIDELMVEKMLAQIKKTPDALVVCGKMIGKKAVSVVKNTTITGDLAKHVITSILKSGHLYSPCNKIYNLSIIKEHNIRFVKEAKFGEDLIFNFDYLKHVKSIYYLKDCLYYYDQTTDGESFHTKAEFKYRIMMLEHLRSFLGDNIKKPDVALKYNMIHLRWLISTKRAKRKLNKRHE